MKRELITDVFGKLNEEEVFVYYEMPLFFSCKDNQGNLFLLNCVQLGLETDNWVLLPISEERLQRAKNKEIDVRTLFEKPESNLWHFEDPMNGETLKLEITEPKDEYLADAGCYMED